MIPVFQKSIAVISCWYGLYPWYFPYFVHSCSFNPTVDFFYRRVQPVSGITKTETYTYDLLNDNISGITSSDGLTTTFIYNGFGRLFITSLPDVNMMINPTLEWEQTTGRYSKTSYRFSDGGRWNRQYFDVLGREIRKESKGFNEVSIFSTTQYNTQGLVYKQAQPRYATEPAVEVTNLYDQLQRLTSVPNGTTTSTYTYSYSLASGGLFTTTITNGASQSSSKTTDASGKTVKTNDNGGQLDFTYNSWGNQKEAKFGSTTLITNTYDNYGRRTSLTDKNAGTIVYEYDELGKLTKQTDAKNNIHTFLYDAFGRVTSKTGPLGITYYTYYSSGDNVNDNITSITGFSGDITTFQYDFLQRLASESTNVNGTVFTKTFGYDAQWNINKTTYPSGVAINDTYSNNGILRQTSMTYGGLTQSLFTATAANSRGVYTAYNYGNGKSSTVTYDFAKGIPTRYYTSGIQDLNLNFDANTGNLLSRNEAIKGLTKTFTYDNLNRLTGASVNTVQQFTMAYDGGTNNSLGNIQSKSDIGNYRYDAQKINAVRFITTNSAVPTNPPNIISVNTQAITYTPFLKTATINENGYQMAYTYGEDEQRIKSVLTQGGPPLETKYYLGGYEKQEKGATTREIHYVSAGNGLCAIIVKENGVVTPYFVYSDHLGSPLTLTNSAGTVVAEQNFDAWGRYRNPTNWTYNSIPARPDWLYRGFTGHEHLSQFALINMNGRMYDPITCRMLSPDNYVPLPWNTQGYNRYEYANNNPLIYTDPDGEFFWLLIPIIVGAGVNIYDNWEDIQDAFNGGFWNGIGTTIGYGAVGGAQGVASTYLSPILGGVVSSAIGNVGNGVISGKSADEIVNNTGKDIITGLFSAGITKGLTGTFDKIGGFVSNKISNKVIATTVKSFFPNFGAGLTMSTIVDAVDGNGFHFGDDVGDALKYGAINAALAGGAEWGLEVKQRQYDRQTQSYRTVTTNQVVSPQKTVPGYEMANKPISVNPTIHKTTPSTNSQVQQNINMTNRLQRRHSTIIGNNEGWIIKIINR